MTTTILNERDALYLGALLHDVGKFSQRANEAEKFIKHQYLSTAIVERLFGNETVRFIVAHHHKEDLQKSPEKGRKRLLGEIVCEADNLASGERTPDAGVRQQEPLRSIFSSVGLEGQAATTVQQPLSSLTPSGYQMPESSVSAKGDIAAAYAARWQKFSAELEKLAELGSTDTQALAHLYKKYCWCMPSSSFKTVPDISLYEHSRLTAALAMCLYDALGAAVVNDDALEQMIKRVGRREDFRFRLFCGDITGIQSYIYGIAHKGALKALKGRSFFLQHLCSSIAEYYVERFALPHANIIYASGGKFYLLLPETPKTAETLAQIETDTQERFLREYEGALGFVSASLVLSGEDFTARNQAGQKQIPIAKKWDELGLLLEAAKRRPFASSLRLPSFFEPTGAGGNVLRCYATGKELCADTPHEIDRLCGREIFPYSSDDENRDKYISREQYDSRRIGEMLRRADVLGVQAAGGRVGIDALGFGTFTLEKLPSVGAVSPAGAFAAYRLNNDNFLELPAAAKRGWRFYGGNWGFEGDLDALQEKAYGFKQLGMLRMDVDNLGRIFAEGLGAQATFSRVVQLSSMLDFFFSSYLNRLQYLRWNVRDGVNEREGESLADLVSIVYAGGDDVCVIGVWNALPDVAWWIQREFTRFTGNNTNFTVSAGIALFSGKFPVVKASALAGEAEHRAKGKRRAKDDAEASKNALCLFGVPMKWSDVEFVRQWVGNFALWINNGIPDGNGDAKQLNRGIIQRLHRIYGEYQAGKGERWAQWRWRACYSLARFGENNKNFKDQIQSFATELLLGDTSGIKTEQDLVALTGVIATWAEYLTRSEQ